MGNDVVRDRLLAIQSDYKDLLINLRDFFYESSCSAITDEIHTFWFKQRKFIDFVFNNYFEPNRTYLFTAVGYIDIKNNEHYPFFILGTNHVLDDPIHKIILSKAIEKNDEFAIELKKHMFDAICDNIEVLTQCFGLIYILPLGLLFPIDAATIKKGVDSVFLSLFRQQLSLNDFFESIITVDDICLALKPNIKNNLLFNCGGDTGGFVERFSNYKNSMSFPSLAGKSEGHQFYFAMTGFLSQAFDMILICAKYNIIPYVRSETAAYYLRVVGFNFKEVDEVTEILFKAMIAHVLCALFDETQIIGVNLNDFLLRVNEYCFEEKLYEEINPSHSLNQQSDIDNVVRVISKHLHKMLSN